MIPDLSTENADFLREVIKLDSKEDLTDIEELDLVVNGKLHGLQLEFPGTAARFRNLMGMKRGQIGHSPVLEAVKEKSPQVRTLHIAAKFSCLEDLPFISPTAKIMRSSYLWSSTPCQCPQSLPYWLLTFAYFLTGD